MECNIFLPRISAESCPFFDGSQISGPSLQQRCKISRLGGRSPDFLTIFKKNLPSRIENLPIIEENYANDVSFLKDSLCTMRDQFAVGDLRLPCFICDAFHVSIYMLSQPPSWKGSEEGDLPTRENFRLAGGPWPIMLA